MSSNTQTEPASIMQSKPTSPENEPGPDEIHEALAKGRRRHALQIVRQHEPIRKPALARGVAALEYDKTPGEVTDAEENRLVAALHQQHLPYLSKHGFVSWDTNSNIVTLGPYSPLVIRHLDLDMDADVNADGRGKQSIVDRLTNGVF